MNNTEIQPNQNAPSKPQVNDNEGITSHALELEMTGSTHPTMPPNDSENGVRPPLSSPPGWNRILVATIVVLAVIAALVLGFLPRWRQSRIASGDMNQLAIPSVSVVSPGPGKLEKGLVLPAEIQPWREASVYARANGYLKDWVVDIGAHVQADQLLAEIDTPDLDQQLDQTKAQLVLAQANLHLAEITDARWQLLLKTASVTQQAADEKKAGRETAAASVAADEANMRRLEDLVSFQRVVAPFDGTITIRAVDIGDLIVVGSGGQQLFHIAQTDKLRVYVRVPEPDAIGIAPGQTADLTTPESPGRRFTATVITTAEAISPNSRTLLTELEVDNSKHEILPNSFGEVTLKENHAAPMFVLPSSVLIFRAQGLQVALVRPDDTVELRSIRIGRDFGQTVEILEGVAPSERVINNPTDSISSGTRVRIATDAEDVAEK
jgi:membrane fusion protein (multidrug efflux system)